ncbi:MAG: BolA family protein [Aquabacterium sp.]
MTAPQAVTARQIEDCLRAALAPVDAITVQDDSAAHAGHAGAREGRHFSVRIVAARFTGLGRVARHRLVYDALAPLMRNGIHALALHTSAPDETTAAAPAGSSGQAPQP